MSKLLKMSVLLGAPSVIMANAEQLDSRGITSLPGITKYTVSNVDKVYVSEVNSLIERLSGSSYIATIKPDTVVADVSSLNDVSTNANLIKNELLEYEKLQTQLQIQKENYLTNTGILAQDLGKRNITYTSYADLLSKLRNFNNELSELIKENQKLVNQTTTVRDEALGIAVHEANKVISSVSSSNTGAQSGIVGNFDKLRRLADDSRKPGTITSKTATVLDDGVTVTYGENKDLPGVDVTTTNTSRVNNVTVTSDVSPFTKVSTIDEVIRERDRIVNKIKNEGTVNNTKTIDVKNYVDSSTININDINNWLQSEQNRADNIQIEIAKNSTARNHMKNYKDEYLAKLEEIKNYIKLPTTKGSENAKNRIIEKIDEALAKMNDSTIGTGEVTILNGAERVDFGNIGRPTTEIDAIQNDISNDITGRVTTAMEKLREQNAEVDAKIKPIIDDNKKSVDRFVNIIKNSGVSTNIPNEFLENLPIYKDNPTYQEFIKRSLQPQEIELNEEISRKPDEYGNIRRVVSEDTNVADLSYHLYSEDEHNKPFGSVMVPSKNVNDFGEVTHHVFADSQTYKGSGGGIMGIIRDLYMLNGPSYAHAGVNTLEKYMALFAPFVDLKEEYNLDNDASNIHMIVSTKSNIDYKLNSSFVYKDSDDIVQQSDIILKLNLTDVDDNELNPYGMVATANEHVGEYAKRAEFYIYYFKVNPNNGQLIVGGGILPYWLLDGSNTGGISTTPINDNPNLLIGGYTTDRVAENGEDLLVSNDISYEGDDFSPYAYINGRLAQLNTHKGVLTNYTYVNTPTSSTSTTTSSGHRNNSTYSNTSRSNYKTGTVDYSKYVFRSTPPSSTSSLSEWVAKRNYIGQQVFNRNDVNNLIEKGIKIHTGVYVSNDALGYTYDSPLFISDIDSNQQLETKDSFIFTSNEFGAGAVESSRENNDTILDRYAVLLKNYKTGLQRQEFAIAYPQQNPGGDRYNGSVIYSMFAPFGVISEPVLNIDQINEVVDTVAISNPSAVAHSDKSVELSTSLEYLSTPDSELFQQLIQYMSADVALQLFEQPVDTKKVAVSVNNLVVRGQINRKNVASHNTLTVRRLNTPRTVVSHNTLTLRYQNKPTYVSSYNTLVVRQNNNLVFNNTNVNNDVTVNMVVYADDSLSLITRQAISEWVDALHSESVKLNVSYVNDPRNADLLIFDVDKTSTKFSTGDATVRVIGGDETLFEFAETAGHITGIIPNVKLTDDKFTLSGIKDTTDITGKTAIQINTESLTTDSSRRITLKHELGHLFGLVHDDNDSLMSTRLSDSNMTGIISEKSKTLASEYLKRLVNNGVDLFKNTKSHNLNVGPCNCSGCMLNINLI